MPWILKHGRQKAPRLFPPESNRSRVVHKGKEEPAHDSQIIQTIHASIAQAICKPPALSSGFCRIFR
jgi:hypothetical protein